MQKSEDAIQEIHRAPFWSNAKGLSTTTVTESRNAVELWSAQSGMTSKTFTAGLSVPLGKANIGAKYGYQREKSHEQSSQKRTEELAYTAVHEIPTTQINLNESTIILSSNAEADIKKMRKDRSFAELLSFVEKYGSFVFQNITLGGRLYHTQIASSSEAKDEKTEKDSIQHSANASLGIPDTVEAKVGFSSKDEKSTTTGGQESKKYDNLNWTALGGDPRLVVE